MPQPSRVSSEAPEVVPDSTSFSPLSASSQGPEYAFQGSVWNDHSPVRHPSNTGLDSLLKSQPKTQKTFSDRNEDIYSQSGISEAPTREAYRTYTPELVEERRRRRKRRNISVTTIALIVGAFLMGGAIGGGAGGGIAAKRGR